MPSNIKNKSTKKLIIEGTVENATNYMYNKSVMIVPIFSGSGIRIKRLEGMALGRPIISPSKGAKGIPYKNGENIQKHLVEIGLAKVYEKYAFQCTWTKDYLK